MQPNAVVEGPSPSDSEGEPCACSERLGRLDALLQDAVRQVAALTERLAALEAANADAACSATVTAHAAVDGGDERNAWEAAVEGRMAVIEDSVERALATMMPKVEALLQGMERRSNSVLNLAAAASDDQHESSPEESMSVGSSAELPTAPTALAAPAAPVGEAAVATQAHAAAGAGDLDTLLQMLVLHGEAVARARDNRGDTALHRAAAAGQVGALEVLLDATEDASNLVGWHMRTPLHAAAIAGQTDAALSLLAAGANADAMDAEGSAPLHLAAELGMNGVATLLLVEGANARPADARGRVPLHRAAAAGSVAAVSALLEHAIAGDGEPDVMDHRAATPLMMAAVNGHAEVVQALTRAGATLEATDARGQTALHYACIAGADVPEAAVEITAHALIDAGASVDASDIRGRTPLWEAAQRGWSSALRPLLAAGASANAYDAAGVSPLEAAATAGHADALKILLRAGAPSDDQQLGRALCEAANAAVVWALASAAPAVVRGVAGTRAAWRAAGDGRAEALAALLDAGVPPQAVYDGVSARMDDSAGDADDDGDSDIDDDCCSRARRSTSQGCDDNFGPLTLLHEAAERGHVDCVTALLSRGASTSARAPTNLAGRTPLHLASSSGHVRCVSALLTCGGRALADARDSNGDTPLHLAANAGHAECVAALLAAGASPRARNLAGSAPRGFDQRHLDVAEMLKAAAAALAVH